MDTFEPRANIFICVDQGVVRAEVERIVLDSGYGVQAKAESVGKALELVEQGQPDLVMMGLAINGEMEGMETAGVIRDKWGIPVVFINTGTTPDRSGPAELNLPFFYVSEQSLARDFKATLEMALHMARIDAARRKAERDLQECEKRYRGLFNSTNDGVGVYEIIFNQGRPIEYILLDVNPMFETITGISRDRARGSLASEFYRSGEIPYLDLFTKVVSSGKPVACETYLQALDKYFLISVYSISPQMLATEYRDITSHKKMETALRKSEEQFRLTYYTTPDAVNINRLEDGLYVDINEGFTKITGYTREDVIGRTSL